MVVPWIPILVIDVHVIALANTALSDHHAADLVAMCTVLLVPFGPSVPSVLLLVVPSHHLPFFLICIFLYWAVAMA